MTRHLLERIAFLNKEPIPMILYFDIPPFIVRVRRGKRNRCRTHACMVFSSRRPSRDVSQSRMTSLVLNFPEELGGFCALAGRPAFARTERPAGRSSASFILRSLSRESCVVVVSTQEERWVGERAE